MMYKKFLIVIFFVLMTYSAFPAGNGGSGGNGEGAGKPVTQYEIAVKMIKKAKNSKRKIRQTRLKNITKKLLDIY